MKKAIYVLMMALVLAAPALAIGSGGPGTGAPTPDAIVGYTNKDWGVSALQGTVSLYSLSSANLLAADNAVAVIASTLVKSPAYPATKTDVTGKQLAVLNHTAGIILNPGEATSPFPSIWKKGDTVNPATGSADPDNYLIGTDASKFFQTGLSIKATYLQSSNYDWRLFIYADRDVLTQNAAVTTNRVIDPRVATMRWFAWADDSVGVMDMTWAKKSTLGTLETFNTMPLIKNGETIANIKTILNSTDVETLTGAPLIAGSSIAALPSNGTLYYNTDRNSNPPNGHVIASRNKTGMIYVAPNSNFCQGSQVSHIQFIIIYPDQWVVPHSGTKNAELYLFMQTSN